MQDISHRDMTERGKKLKPRYRLACLQALLLTVGVSKKDSGGLKKTALHKTSLFSYLSPPPPHHLASLKGLFFTAGVSKQDNDG
jgi:hypothetical protein